MTVENVVMIMLILASMFAISIVFFNNNQPKEKQEELPGYDNFLSESREAAFDYIEDVQDILDEYFSEVDILLEMYSKSSRKNTKADYVAAMKQIKESTDKLRSAMPED